MCSWPAGQASSVHFFALTSWGEDGEVVQVGVGILSESECEARTVSYEVVSER